MGRFEWCRVQNRIYEFGMKIWPDNSQKKYRVCIFSPRNRVHIFSSQLNSWKLLVDWVNDLAFISPTFKFTVYRNMTVYSRMFGLSGFHALAPKTKNLVAAGLSEVVSLLELLQVVLMPQKNSTKKSHQRR